VFAACTCVITQIGVLSTGLNAGPDQLASFYIFYASELKRLWKRVRLFYSLFCIALCTCNLLRNLIEFACSPTGRIIFLSTRLHIEQLPARSHTFFPNVNNSFHAQMVEKTFFENNTSTVFMIVHCENVS